MSASGNELNLQKVTSKQYDTSSCNDADDLILKYVFTLKGINPAWLAKPFVFSEKISIPYQIAYIVENAVPLDVFEKFVRNYAKIYGDNKPNALIDTKYTVDLNTGITIQGTLIQLLAIVLDQSVIRDACALTVGSNLDEGLANRFIKLVGELWPTREIEVIKHMQNVIPEIPMYLKDENETAALNALKILYMTVLANTDNEFEIQAGITIFKNFLQETKLKMSNEEGAIINRRYHLLLVYMNYEAFNLGQDIRRLFPNTVKRFRLIIGETIQAHLPARTRQMLKVGFANLLSLEKMIDAPRTFFTSLDKFKGVDTNKKLGVDFYYSASLRQYAYYQSLKLDCPTTPAQNLHSIYNNHCYKATQPLHDTLKKFLVMLECQNYTERFPIPHMFIASILKLLMGNNVHNLNLFNFDELAQLVNQYQRVMELAATDINHPELSNECIELTSKAQTFLLIGEKTKYLSIIGYAEVVAGTIVALAGFLLFPLMVTLAIPAVNLFLLLGFYPIFTLACAMMGWSVFDDGIKALTHPLHELIPVGNEAQKMAMNVATFFNRRNSLVNRVEVDLSEATPVIPAQAGIHL